jgi:alkyl hydroperoxide reductase subunit AhpC
MGHIPDRLSQCATVERGRGIMSLRINSEVPDFTAETTQGKVNFHDWIGDGWAIMFSHPKDFTPVCTTELGYMAGLLPEFQKRNCKIIGLSVDPVGNTCAGRTTSRRPRATLSLIP